MAKDFLVYLDDIIEAIDRIEDYTRAFSYENFFDDRKTQDAVMRRITIIGEAAKRIPDELNHPRLKARESAPAWKATEVRLRPLPLLFPIPTPWGGGRKRGRGDRIVVLKPSPEGEGLRDPRASL